MYLECYLFWKNMVKQNYNLNWHSYQNNDEWLFYLLMNKKTKISPAAEEIKVTMRATLGPACVESKWTPPFAMLSTEANAFGDSVYTNQR